MAAPRNIQRPERARRISRPAIAYCVWMTLRSDALRAIVAAGIALFLMLALLITFSRGAWVAAFLALSVLVWFSIITARQNRHSSASSW